MARNTAQSWGEQESFEKYGELDSIRSQIYSRTRAERWAVNVSVHYSNWANLSAADFQPVIDAFRDLFTLFICLKCGSLLHVTKEGTMLQNVRCNCGKINWNLVRKKG